MFSEDTIINYCDLCKQCDEVKRCPVKAVATQRQISGTYIPASAIETKAIENNILFKHINKRTLTIRSLSNGLNELNESIFHGEFEM